MKILLVEDTDEKAAQIQALIEREVPAGEADVVRVSTVNDTLVQLGKGHYDLVVVDLVLPQTRNDNEACDATRQWCEQIENHVSGKTASWIVMTGYPEVADEARESFARHNVAVIQYDETGHWERLLAGKMRELYRVRPLDFLVVCALLKERRGYANADCALGDHEVVVGLDCQRIEIGGLRGAIVVQPAPGMISAAVTACKALNVFRPRAVAMSGICGGRKGETGLGAVIVPDISWNYQSGKFRNGKLTPDLSQVSIPPHSRSILSQMSTSEMSSKLRDGLMHTELSHAPIQMQPMVSGSQVVADAAVSAQIEEQGRKVAGIDMEVASILFAAHDFFNGGGVFFAAKAVVDLANPDKDDRYHEYGCALSARFVVEAMPRLLT